MHTDRHAQQRARFLAALGNDAALLFGSNPTLRNGTTEHRFRQNSDILYLTGWTQPQVAILLRPNSDQPFIMFVRPKNPSAEMWDGYRPGPEGAVEAYGADAAFPYEELPERLPGLLQGYQTLHYPFADDPDLDRLVSGAIRKARRQARRNGLDVPDAFIDPARLLHELRLIKTPAELEVMRQGAKITEQAHRAAMAATRPGVHEFEIEAIIEGTFRRMGATGPSYPSIVGGGANATVLHYIDNNARLPDEGIVCVDAGCEYQGYASDVTRSWPVSGRFSSAQKALYEVVLQAQLATIGVVRVGGAFRDLHDTATRKIAEGLVALGLLSGNVDEIIETEAHRKFFMHGTSHWLGLDVHDVGAYAHGGESRRLEPGMVMTVEPGLYIGSDNEDVPPEFRGIGIRIEDDVVVTDGEPEVLTAAIPKTIAEVEAAVLAGRR
ncbi:MAG: aminopeptidase P N-terminal domain-containing protein [Myxococcota bacterium]